MQEHKIIHLTFHNKLSLMECIYNFNFTASLLLLILRIPQFINTEKLPATCHAVPAPGPGEVRQSNSRDHCTVSR